jgi:hypothetical protein
MNPQFAGYIYIKEKVHQYFSLKNGKLKRTFSTGKKDFFEFFENIFKTPVLQKI